MDPVREGEQQRDATRTIPTAGEVSSIGTCRRSAGSPDMPLVTTDDGPGYAAIRLRSWTTAARTRARATAQAGDWIEVHVIGGGPPSARPDPRGDRAPRARALSRALGREARVDPLPRRRRDHRASRDLGRGSRHDQHGTGGAAQQPLGDGAEQQRAHGAAPARAAHQQVELRPMPPRARPPGRRCGRPRGRVGRPRPADAPARARGPPWTTRRSSSSTAPRSRRSSIASGASGSATPIACSSAPTRGREPVARPRAPRGPPASARSRRRSPQRLLGTVRESRGGDSDRAGRLVQQAPRGALQGSGERVTVRRAEHDDRGTLVRAAVAQAVCRARARACDEVERRVEQLGEQTSERGGVARALHAVDADDDRPGRHCSPQAGRAATTARGGPGRGPPLARAKRASGHGRDPR